MSDSVTGKNCEGWGLTPEHRQLNRELATWPHKLVDFLDFYYSKLARNCSPEGQGADV